MPDVTEARVTHAVLWSRAVRDTVRRTTRGTARLWLSLVLGNQLLGACTPAATPDVGAVRTATPAGAPGRLAGPPAAFVGAANAGAPFVGQARAASSPQPAAGLIRPTVAPVTEAAPATAPASTTSGSHVHHK